jgi:hypothetical protein
METTTKMETARSGKKLVTDEVVLSMLIDIHQKSSSNYLDYDDLREKYRGTVASILSVLRKREIIIKCGKSIVWQGDYPDMKMATSIKNEYRESARISSKKSQENRAKLAQYKKHQDSIKLAEEVILDPLNFEVPLSNVQDSEITTIDKDILQLENEKLKSIIERKDETIIARQEEYNDLLYLSASYKKKISELEFHSKDNKEKRAIRLFGIKIGSIG